MTFTLSSLVVTATLSIYCFGIAEAFWRLPCQGISGLGRLDPIVQPGVPSDHVHAVFGGSGEFYSDFKISSYHQTLPALSKRISIL